jgi:hypothetical protein
MGYEEQFVPNSSIRNDLLKSVDIRKTLNKIKDDGMRNRLNTYSVNVRINDKVKINTMSRRRVSCIIQHHTLKTYGGSRGTAPRILNLGTTCR